MQQKSIGKFIRQKRLATGKTLNSFAFFIGIEPAIISRIENDKQDIKFEVLRKIAEGFNKNLSDFIKEFELYEKS